MSIIFAIIVQFGRDSVWMTGIRLRLFQFLWRGRRQWEDIRESIRWVVFLIIFEFWLYLILVQKDVIKYIATIQWTRKQSFWNRLKNFMKPRNHYEILQQILLDFSSRWSSAFTKRPVSWRVFNDHVSLYSIGICTIFTIINCSKLWVFWVLSWLKSWVLWVTEFDFMKMKR